MRHILAAALAFVATLTLVSSQAFAGEKEIDAAVKPYNESLQTKGAWALSTDAGVNLGLTLAHCGADYSVGTFHSISKSTDLETLTKELKTIEASESCRIASIKLGMALSLLKAKSAAGFEAFMNMARVRIADALTEGIPAEKK
jgi:hypothetical protein